MGDFVEQPARRPLYPEVGVLALVPDYWGPYWQARHHILSRLARYFRVLWMEPALELRPLLRGQRRKKLWPEQEPVPGLELYRPQWWLPALGKPEFMAQCTLRWRLRQARQRLLRQGCRKIVLCLWRPDFAPALRLVPHDLSCYYIDDEYSFSPVELPLTRVEENLIRSAGQVFIHSPAMMEKKGGLNLHTQFAPNGVDYGDFSRLQPEPEDLRNVPHPRIGYCGGLKDVLDWPLLLQLVQSHPAWSFVFVGSVRPHPQLPGYVRQLNSHANVFLLGRKSTAELSAYVQHFDICLMPYLRNDYTRYIYPLKMHEYLAGGRPLVSSPIRTAQEFPDVVLTAESPEQWSRMVERALSPQENAPERRAQRQRVAQAHDWNGLVENIAASLAARLGIQFRAASRVPAEHNSPALTL